MKTSYVMTDHEREKKFSKLKTIEVKNNTNLQHYSSSQNPPLVTTVAKIPELYMAFTVEEEQQLINMKSRLFTCNYKWFQDFMNMDEEASINIIRFTLNGDKLHYRTWEAMLGLHKIHLINNVLAKFTEILELPLYDQSVLLNGENFDAANSLKHALILIWQFCAMDTPVLAFVKDTTNVVRFGTKLGNSLGHLKAKQF